jgi:hypothetical protein
MNGRDPALDKLRKTLIEEIAEVSPDAPLRKTFESENQAKVALREADAVIDEHHPGGAISAHVEGLDLVVEESFGH